MKKIKYFLAICVMILSAVLMPACATISVDYDLASLGETATYTTVTKMQTTPINYKNKTFRIEGEFKKSGSSYQYLMGYDSANCCTWNLEVKAGEGVTLPSKSKTIVAVGVFRCDKANGQTTKYLEITDIK